MSDFPKFRGQPSFISGQKETPGFKTSVALTQSTVVYFCPGNFKGLLCSVSHTTHLCFRIQHLITGGEKSTSRMTGPRSPIPTKNPSKGFEVEKVSLQRGGSVYCALPFFSGTPFRLAWCSVPFSFFRGTPFWLGSKGQ